MELFPEEAIATNVLGTANLIQASIAADVKQFVLIPSDKAVNPTSVMGATKRIAELLVVDAARRTGRSYVAVRFGNVLSSRGSVVPLFRRQLNRGGPLTVTHPDVSRFFMTIPEAVQLVLQASVLARSGDMFVLDMGSPVKIADLARDLIELHGLDPDRDVDIEFVGLRPGEKLSEELYSVNERAERTEHEAIMRIVSPESLVSPWDALPQLAELIATGDHERIVAGIRSIVPEYSNSARRTGWGARS